jgi:hypothetical protein
MDPLTFPIIAWIFSLLLIVGLLIVPRAAAAIASWRQLKRQSASAQALYREAREKELLELLATDPDDECLDLVGCILCRFDLQGHKS